MKIDIYADGELGLWALRAVDPSDVATVITTDRTVLDYAGSLFFAVVLSGDHLSGVPKADVGICVHYHRLFTQDELRSYKALYNLHPSMLPWGRGWYPVFWALWEGSPAGATLHRITEKVDSGPVVSQRSVLYSEEDTGRSLHSRVSEAERNLFSEYWPKLVSGEELVATDQPAGGSYHSRSEFLDIQEASNWRQLSGSDLVRLVRAMTFPGFPGLHVQCGNRHYELSLLAKDR